MTFFCSSRDFGAPLTKGPLLLRIEHFASFLSAVRRRRKVRRRRGRDPMQQPLARGESFSIGSHIQAKSSLVRYRSRPDESFHELRTAMHHQISPNRERAVNLSILATSGPGEFPRIESN